MAINIAEINHPKGHRVLLEISNDKEFVSRIRQVSAELPGLKRDNMKLWKIRRIGSGNVPADIQRLMDGTDVEQTEIAEALEETSKRTGETPKQILKAAKQELDTAVEKPKRKVIRARPGGSL